MYHYNPDADHSLDRDYPPLTEPTTPEEDAELNRILKKGGFRTDSHLIGPDEFCRTILGIGKVLWDEEMEKRGINLS